MAETVRGQDGTAVCVAGPGRSGTSLTMRVLSLLGVYAGPEEVLLSSGPGNREGFWEHPDLVALNERILEAMGGGLLAPPRLQPGWESSLGLATERDRARALLRELFAERDTWGWKDPRNSLTLPFWRRLAPGIRCVICVRNPLDVAASLGEVGIPRERAFGFWLAYTASTILNTAGQPRLFVCYEDYFGEWRSVAERLARFVDLDPAPLEREAGERIGEAVNDSLRHHHASVEALVEDRRVPEDVTSLYLMVRPLGAAEERVGGAAVPLQHSVDAYAGQALERLYEKTERQPAAVAAETGADGDPGAA